MVFGELFHTYYEKLHRYAYTLLKDNDEANDAVQAVFTRLWEKRDEIVFEDAIKGYLYRATHNYCLNNIRQADTRGRYIQHQSRDKQAEQTRDATDKVVAAELQARIHNAIDSLPAQCKLIFRKSREEGLKYAEIAEELSLSVKTVEAQMSKALRILREKLAGYIEIILILLYYNS